MWEQQFQAFCQAIAEHEGFYIAGSCAQRGNNPGNVRARGQGELTHRCGSSGTFRYFQTLNEGWYALYRQVGLNISRGLTLYEFFGGTSGRPVPGWPGGYPGYAPAADRNDPGAYARVVAKKTGIPLDVPLNGYFRSLGCPYL